MSKHHRVVVSAIVLATAALGLVTARAEKYGPFPIRLSHVENMTFTYNRKLEAPAQTIDLATDDPSGMALIDGVLTLLSDATVSVPSIDPVTGLPAVDANGKPIMEKKVLPAGTVLDPKTNPADNYLLPKGVMVSAQAVADGDYTIGRFAYLGVAPRFESKNLEMYASKMGHSLRVKGWVTQDLLDTYEYSLLSKFKSYYDMFAKPTIHLEPLRDLKRIAASEKNADRKKWDTVASYYSKTLYENDQIDVYDGSAGDEAYKNAILTVMIRTYLHDPSATVEGGLALYNKYKSDPGFLATRREASTALFKANLAGNYVEGQPVEPIYPIAPLVAPSPLPSGAPIPSPVPSPVPVRPHADALGVATFVYPIAIDKEGPFKLPSPGLRRFPLNSSVEGRWFSNRWLGEFGGFPFLQITVDGVAFHGPITMNTLGDTWFLRRDNVSHSCMRMDGSDVMELRALIPKNMLSLQKLGQTIPLWITEWPDVADLDNDGKREVVDVAYYSMPTSGAGINKPENWKPEAYNKNYWKKHFSPYVGRLRSKNTFTISVKDGANVGEFTGLPKYDVVNGVLKAVGYYTETLPVRTVPQRPTQIIQYREDGFEYENADADGADRWGAYPPGVVNKF